MSDKILHCPFCSGEAQTVHYGSFVTVCCTECGAKIKWYEWDKDAIEAWNRRVPVADEYEVYG